MRGPGAVARYLATLLAGKPERHVGHNPAGALAILAMLGLTLAIVGSGWALYQQIAGGALEDVHKVLANAMLALVAVHVAAVLLSSWLHREDLVAAMISGRKQGVRAAGIGKAWRGLAVLILAAAASSLSRLKVI